MNEAEMMSGLRQTAKQLGYLCYHNTYAIGSDKGYPDLHIVGHGREWFLELKGPKPKVYDEQRVWIEALQALGHDARFVHPPDYDAVVQELMDAYQESHLARSE